MKPFEHLFLDNQLCFALYAATNAITRCYRGPLADAGLTYPQYLVMMLLWQHGEFTAGKLATELQLDASTLTPILKRLESAGWVERRRQTSDERVVCVSLTPAGRSLRKQVAPIQREVACKTGLSETEFIDLRKQLHELTHSMTEPRTAGSIGRNTVRNTDQSTTRDAARNTARRKLS